MIESRYNVLYRDRQGWGCSKVATTQLGDPATRTHDTARKGHDTVGLCAGACGSARARAAWLAEGHDTKFCIMAEGGDLWVEIQHNKAMIRRNNAPRYGVGSCVTYGSARGETQQGLCVSIQFCIAGREAVTWRACDTIGHGHDTVPSARTVCEQPGSVGCAPCAPNSVLA